MPTSSATLLPFYGQYPAGYTPPATSGGSGGADDPVDIVDIRSGRATGTFTAAAGDLFALRDLYHVSAPAGSVVGYKVALRSDQSVPDAGRLMRGDQDVTGQVDFTPQQFSQLHFVAGNNGNSQDLVVVAQTGTRASDGTLTNLADSPAVQLTASVTGTRSLNALDALLTPATGSDARFVVVAQDASIHSGLANRSRPSLGSVGNPYAPPTGVGALVSLPGASQSSAMPTSGTAAFKRCTPIRWGRRRLPDARLSAAEHRSDARGLAPEHRRARRLSN